MTFFKENIFTSVFGLIIEVFFRFVKVTLKQLAISACLLHMDTVVVALFINVM